MTVVCLTFDHLGSAQRVGQGVLNRPDPDDVGIRVGLPAVERLLDDADVRATFFVEGWSLLHYPAEVERLLANGHEVALHGWVHERWTDLDAGAQERVLADGLAALHLAGVTTAGFRAPHGVLTADTPALLTELGYRFDSSLLAADDTPPRELRALGEELTNVPFAWPMVDAWQYKIRPDPLSASALADTWIELVAATRSDDGDASGGEASGGDASGGDEVVTLVAHPHISGVRPDARAALERVLRVLTDDDTVAFRRVGDVARQAAGNARV